MNKPINISLTSGSIIKIILLFLAMYFLYLIKDILAILFVSLILSSALDPWVDWMQTKKIPRALGILFIYFVSFLILGGAIYLIIPPIAQQVGELANDFPRYVDKVISGFAVFKAFTIQHNLLDSIKNSLGSWSSNLQTAASSIFSTVTGIFGGIFSFFLVLILTFYMVVEESAIKKLVWSIAPAEYQPYLLGLINRIQIKIGMWLRGQMILSLIIFVMTYIGLSILGVKYALVLALIAGITEAVPYLGPILGSIPGVFLSFTQSPMLALFAAILYYVIQMVENNILVPKIMERAVGLNPIISIAALMIGLQIGGIVGAILSIPVATAVSVIVSDIFEHKNSAGSPFIEKT